MITFFIISLSIASFATGFYFEMPEVSLLTLQLFSAYVFCCFFDAICGLIFLQRTASRKGTKSNLHHPLTWVGRHLSTYQEAISYRINFIPEQQNHREAPADMQSPQPATETQESFFQQILSELESSFKPATTALIVQNKTGQALEVSMRGIRGKRLQEQLKSIFSDYFVSDDTKWLGQQDTLHHDFPTEELAALGLRYLVSSGFEQNGSKGIIMLGYGAEKDPAAFILNSLNEYAKKLERDFGTFASFQQLKSQVVKAEEVSEAKTDFLTHISHDIKSPLNNVKAILSLLREDVAGSEDSQKLVDTALRNCDSAADLVSSLVDFAKHRSGKLIANKATFNLSNLVDDVVQSFTSAAKAKGLSINFVAPIAQVNCVADKIQIMRILNNLIGNSIKYTQTGRITVGVHAQDEHTWTVRITDTGPGFSDQQLKEIFTPFTRFDTQGIEGAGLGLAVSKILTELNSGTLMLRSVEGAGSVFTVSIPAAIQENEASIINRSNKIIDFNSISQHVSQQKREKRLEGLKLLVVDDDPDSTQGLSRILAKEGADIAQANTVPDAMSIINFDRPDVLITDSKMPEGGGSKLIKFMRLNLPEAAIVVVSGDISNADELIALGASCVMDKPVHISELIDYLEDILRVNNRQQVVGF